MFFCNNCIGRFETKEGFELHSAEKHGDLLYKCTTCGWRFRNPEILEKHYKRNNCQVSINTEDSSGEEESVSKTNSSNTFIRWEPDGMVNSSVHHSSPSKLVSHSKSVPFLRRTFTCSECNLIFKSEEDFTKHKKNVHEKYIRCPTCNWDMEGEDMYQRHTVGGCQRARMAVHITGNSSTSFNLTTENQDSSLPHFEEYNTSNLTILNQEQSEENMKKEQYKTGCKNQLSNRSKYKKEEVRNLYTKLMSKGSELLNVAVKSNPIRIEFPEAKRSENGWNEIYAVKRKRSDKQNKTNKILTEPLNSEKSHARGVTVWHCVPCKYNFTNLMQYECHMIYHCKTSYCKVTVKKLSAGDMSFQTNSAKSAKLTDTHPHHTEHEFEKRVHAKSHNSTDNLVDKTANRVEDKIKKCRPRIKNKNPKIKASQFRESAIYHTKKHRNKLHSKTGENRLIIGEDVAGTVHKKQITKSASGVNEKIKTTIKENRKQRYIAVVAPSGVNATELKVKSGGFEKRKKKRIEISEERCVGGLAEETGLKLKSPFGTDLYKSNENKSKRSDSEHGSNMPASSHHLPTETIEPAVTLLLENKTAEDPPASADRVNDHLKNRDSEHPRYERTIMEEVRNSEKLTDKELKILEFICSNEKSLGIKYLFGDEKSEDVSVLARLTDGDLFCQECCGIIPSSLCQTHFLGHEKSMGCRSDKQVVMSYQKVTSITCECCKFDASCLQDLAEHHMKQPYIAIPLGGDSNTQSQTGEYPSVIIRNYNKSKYSLVGSVKETASSIALNQRDLVQIESIPSSITSPPSVKVLVAPNFGEHLYPVPAKEKSMANITPQSDVENVSATMENDVPTSQQSNKIFPLSSGSILNNVSLGEQLLQKNVPGLQRIPVNLQEQTDSCATDVDLQQNINQSEMKTLKWYILKLKQLYAKSSNTKSKFYWSEIFKFNQPKIRLATITLLFNYNIFPHGELIKTRHSNLLNENFWIEETLKDLLCLLQQRAPDCTTSVSQQDSSNGTALVNSIVPEEISRNAMVFQQNSDTVTMLPTAVPVLETPQDVLPTLLSPQLEQSSSSAAVTINDLGQSKPIMLTKPSVEEIPISNCRQLSHYENQSFSSFNSQHPICESSKISWYYPPMSKEDPASLERSQIRNLSTTHMTTRNGNLKYPASIALQSSANSQQNIIINSISSITPQQKQNVTNNLCLRTSYTEVPNRQQVPAGPYQSAANATLNQNQVPSAAVARLSRGDQAPQHPSILNVFVNDVTTLNRLHLNESGVAPLSSNMYGGQSTHNNYNQQNRVTESSRIMPGLIPQGWTTRGPVQVPQYPSFALTIGQTQPLQTPLIDLPNATHRNDMDQSLDKLHHHQVNQSHDEDLPQISLPVRNQLHDLDSRKAIVLDMLKRFQRTCIHQIAANFSESIIYPAKLVDFLMQQNIEILKRICNVLDSKQKLAEFIPHTSQKEIIPQSCNQLLANQVAQLPPRRYPQQGESYSQEYVRSQTYTKQAVGEPYQQQKLTYPSLIFAQSSNFPMQSGSLLKQLIQQPPPMQHMSRPSFPQQQQYQIRPQNLVPHNEIFPQHQ